MEHLIPAKVRDAFDLAAFRWAREQVDAEIKAGFPLVSAVESWGAESFVRYVGAMPPPKQREYWDLCLRLFHPRGAELESVAATPAERERHQTSISERLSVVPMRQQARRCRLTAKALQLHLEQLLV